MVGLYLFLALASATFAALGIHCLKPTLAGIRPVTSPWPDLSWVVIGAFFCGANLALAWAA